MGRRRSVPLEQQREALSALDERLEELYGTPTPRRTLPPLDELVLTILSQNTTDTNRDRAWERLRARFDGWREVVEAPVAEVEEALRPGGLHRTKARRIREVLGGIHERRGSWDLDHLHEAPLEEARNELEGIKGLGAKSVNCILLFSLGKAAFPADTHVHRVLHRIGVHECKGLTRTNRELQDAVEPERMYALHVNLIRHGRRVCHARRPECWRCGIVDLCGYPDKTARPAD